MGNPKVVPGGISKRFVATIIDGIVAGLLAQPPAIIIELLSGNLSPEQQLFAGIAGWLIGVFVSVLYYGWFYKNKGATPGKMLFNLKVVDSETGANLDYGQTVLREIFGKLIGSLILMIGYIMAIFREDKRGLHDLIAKTQVIQT